jgi:serine/threonine-protein kinase HipA
VKKLEVDLSGGLVGTLVESGTGEIYFEYAEPYLAGGVSLSPYFLPLKPGLQGESTLVFGGLFGAFDDSLPDGWGLILMDREFRRRGLDPARLSPLDRLAYVGSRGLGGLVYRPPATPEGPDDFAFDLAALAAQAERIAKGSPEEALPALLALGGSPAGARPKILVGYDPAKRIVIPDPEALPPGFERWIVTFRAGTDGPEAGRVEAAYHAMAREAGLDVPEAALFPTRSGDFFGLRRFDRDPSDRRIHTHTFGGLIHASFRFPSRDYAELLEIAFNLTKANTALEEAYRRAVFNVLAHNRDDHVKNIAFQLGTDRCWRLAPAFDLTFSDGIRGQHNMTVLGLGEPGPAALIRLAGQGGLGPRRARAILDQVESAVSRWTKLAREHGVSPALQKSIAEKLNRVRRSGG